METTSSPTSTPRSLTRRDVVALLAWLLTAAGLVALSFFGQTDIPRDLLYRYEFAVSTVFSFGLLLALTFMISLAYRDPLPAVGIRGFASRWLWIALGLIVAAVIVSLALEPILHAGRDQGLAPERWRPDRLWAFVANAIVIVTVVPLGEELFFRGLGVRALAPLGDAVAVAGTALVFSLAHGLLTGIPPLFLFGLAVAWVRLRSDSVWPGVLAHGAYNALGIAAIVLTWVFDIG
jgi:membrane protease YdiL (CAAX protease family)